LEKVFQEPEFIYMIAYQAQEIKSIIEVPQNSLKTGYLARQANDAYTLTFLDGTQYLSQQT
jgi:hypothetical protein